MDTPFTAITPGFNTGMTRHSHLLFSIGDNGIVTLNVDGEQAFQYGVNHAIPSDFTFLQEWYGERHKFLNQFDHLDEDFANMHFVYTLDFGAGNVITVRVNGINYRTQTGTDRGLPTSWGNLVGHGTGIFKDIKLQGTAYHDEFGVITHEGTIMGFTGFP